MGISEAEADIESMKSSEIEIAAILFFIVLLLMFCFSKSIFSLSIIFVFEWISFWSLFSFKGLSQQFVATSLSTEQIPILRERVCEILPRTVF